MIPYDYANPSKTHITILEAGALSRFIDYSSNWQIDPITVGNVVLKACCGKRYSEHDIIHDWESILNAILADIPEAAVFHIGFIEDYHYRRSVIMTEFVVDFFNTLLCEFRQQGIPDMMFKEMQILKYVPAGVYINHE